jgi:hydroxyethylthiazole kinase-like uncharacterized protein yjeF
MKLFTAKQLKEWDAYTIKQEPVKSIDLMERAAKACFEWLNSYLPLIPFNKNSIPADCIHIFCGKGNNGADGLAIARMLLENNYKTTVYILDAGNTSTHDFEINLKRLTCLNSIIHFIRDHSSFPVIKKNDIVLDALFGTGLNRPVEGLAASLIECINLSKSTVISVDIPSGMYADKSCKDLTKIMATYTLSFQNYKTCFLMAENEEAMGKVKILNIGLHEHFAEIEPTHYHLIDFALINRIYKPRKNFGHKGTYGHALIAAGSYGKMGAAVLTAKACLRSGAGLLTVLIPEGGYEIMQTSVPEAMVLTGKQIPHKKFDVIGIGPGLNTTSEAVKLVSQVVQTTKELTTQKSAQALKSKLVLDADALNILSSNQELLSALFPLCILTPHPKEFERLFGKTNNEFESHELALKKAAQYNCFIILKGHHSFIATPMGQGYFNNTGNAGMATAGSGDVLTGILTGLAAQGYPALETCMLGVYLHGLAGDFAAAALSKEAMIAGDIINFLGKAYQFLLKHKQPV